jgi:hypothetical protein
MEVDFGSVLGGCFEDKFVEVLKEFFVFSEMNWEM